MVSWATRVVEIGGPQLGILVRKELGGLLVGFRRRLGIQLAGWQGRDYSVSPRWGVPNSQGHILSPLPGDCVRFGTSATIPLREIRCCMPPGGSSRVRGDDNDR